MVEKRKGIITMGGDPLTLVGSSLEVGDEAPQFKATNLDLSEFSSEELEGKIKVYSSVISLDTKV